MQNLTSAQGVFPKEELALLAGLDEGVVISATLPSWMEKLGCAYEVEGVLDEAFCEIYQEVASPPNARPFFSSVLHTDR